MSSFSVPPNQRTHPRHKTAKEARVIYPDERGLVGVIVKDLSVDGARIRLKSSTDLSGKFNIFVPAEKMLYTASVRWMKGPEVGVQFMSEARHVALKAVD
ncbi:MAG: PilZ domain-containing protein [Aestuariivirga sp.]